MNNSDLSLSHLLLYVFLTAIITALLSISYNLVIGNATKADIVYYRIKMDTCEAICRDLRWQWQQSGRYLLTLMDRVDSATAYLETTQGKAIARERHKREGRIRKR